MRLGPTSLALETAENTLTTWLAEPERCAAALGQMGDFAALREQLSGRVRDVLAHELPWAANRRWACESIRAWSPIAALLDPPGGSYGPQFDLLVEFEHGHLFGELGSQDAVCAALRADGERLALEIDIATDLADVLEPGTRGASGWVRDFRAMSLILADYLHRCTLDLPPSLPDALAHHYAGEVARVQRELRDACLAARQIPATVQLATVCTAA